MAIAARKNPDLFEIHLTYQKLLQYQTNKQAFTFDLINIRLW